MGWQPRSRRAMVVVGVWMVALGAHAAGPAREPGAMLREGVSGDAAGRYEIPEALRWTRPQAWPASGWFRLTLATGRVEIEPVASTANRQPPFLEAIVAAIGKPAPDVQIEAPDRIYLRVPGASLVEGARPAYVFQNKTSHLKPRLDFRYELQLGDQPFALTVRNGLRTAAGAPYGSGAQYTIEVDGKAYEYVLGEFGWLSTVEAIADLDGDGKPDFIISVGGNNSGYEAIVLSSKAVPGRNVPTASLLGHGC